MVGKNNRSREVRSNLKEHYKAYKAGKRWLFASIAGLSMGAALFFGSTVNTLADTSDSTSTTADSSSTESAKLQPSSSATLSTSSSNQNSTAKAETTSSSDAAAASSSSSDTATSNAATSTSTSSTDSSTNDSDTGVTDDNSESASSNSDAAASSNTTSGETATGSEDSDSDGATTSADTVKETNLGSTDAQTIETAKQAAAAAFLLTGQAQEIVASSATTTAEVTIGTTTKTYDNDADTPLNYVVTLANGLDAPTDWYATSTTNQYEVSSDSGDLDTSTVSQNVGIYTGITLSDTGIARLQAANTNTTITADNIVTGSLVIEAVEAPSNSVTVTGGSKPYDDDASTDPSSYVVTLGSSLVAPSDWTDNGDGTYTVSVASGDIDAEITSQDYGSYQITLSDQGLADLSAVNTNYSITSAAVTAGWFNIVTNYQAIIGSKSLTVGSSLPTSYLVSISNASSYTVPSDWTVSATNSADDTTVYTVPSSYFDTSSVQMGVAGTYTVSFTSATETSLNNANTSYQLTALNVGSGVVLVHSATTSSTTFYPANFFVTLNNTNVESIYSSGSLLELDLRLLNNNAAINVDNLTEYLVIPSGFVVGDTDANGNAEVATDPASTVTSEIQTYLTKYSVAYSGLSVTQETSYDSRQVFKIHFDSVTTFNSNSIINNYFPVTVVTDPNSTTTSGYIGATTTAKNSAVLYLTDNYADTQGAYTVDGYGAYINIPEVANALGIDDAYTIDPVQYSAYTHKYSIVQAKVTDTYNFVDPNGTNIGTTSTTGLPQTTYNTLSLIPTTIVKNGITYELASGAVDTYVTYPAITTSVTSANSVVQGNTYTVQYLEVVDTSTTNGTITGQTMTWTGSTPTSYTVSLPTGLVAPSTWTDNGNGTYTVSSTNSDLDTSDVEAAVGTYDVTLSAQGLADLASANPDYLFDNQIITAGTVTINQGDTDYTVNVVDSDGHVLKTATEQDLSYPTGGDVDGVDISVPNYTADEISSITVTANSTTNGVTSIVYTNNGTDSTTVTTTSADGTSQTETVPYAISDAMVIGEYGLGYGATPEMSDTDKATMSQYKDITVVYNTQAADQTVTYVDDDEDGATVGDITTVGTYLGETGTYTVSIPDNYDLASDQATSIDYTVTGETADNITVHLVHQHTITADAATTTDTVTTTGLPTNSTTDINTVSWQSDLDQVTNVTTWTPTTANTTYTPTAVAGYTVDPTSIDLTDGLTATTTEPTGRTYTVTYIPETQTLTVTYVDDDSGDTTVQTDTVDGVTDESGTYTATAPTNYKLAADQAASLAYTLTATGAALTVHLVHAHTITAGAVTTTDTVTTTGLPTNNTTDINTVSWQSDLDQVTKVTTWTPTTANTTYTPTAVAGYTVDPTSIDLTDGLAATTTEPAGRTYTVTYTPEAQTLTVNYVDTLTGDIVKTDEVSGVTDGTGTYTVTVPANYALAAGQAKQLAYKLAVGGTTLTVKLTHQIIDGTTTTTRTIDYKYADGSTAAPSVTQKITWNTVTDAVTGTSYATAKDTYGAVTSPTLSGYTVSEATVPADYPGSMATSQLADSTVTVTYTAIPANPDNGGGSTTDPTNPDNGGGTTTEPTDPDGNGGTTTPGGDGDVTTTPGQPVVVPSGTAAGHGSSSSDSQTAGSTSTTGVSAGRGRNLASTLADATGTTNNSGDQMTNKQLGSMQNTGSQAAKLPQTSEQHTNVLALVGVSLLGLLGLAGFGRKKRKEDD